MQYINFNVTASTFALYLFTLYLSFTLVLYYVLVYAYKAPCASVQ